MSAQDIEAVRVTLNKAAFGTDHTSDLLEADAALSRVRSRLAHLEEGLRQRERLLRWSLNYIGINWDESHPDEPPAVTEARSLLADQGGAE